MEGKLEKTRNFLKKSFEIIVILAVLGFIINSDYSIKDNPFPNPFTFGAIFIVSTLFGAILLFKQDSKSTRGKAEDIIMLMVYGLYIVTIYGYTFYQWDISAKKTDSECSMTIPRTKNYSKSQYYLYRIMYLTTLIVIVVLIQNLLDKGGITSDWNKYLVLLPLLLPVLTEMVNGVVSGFSPDEYKINPESLLANFMLGDSKSDIISLRSIITFIFYLLLMGVAIQHETNQNLPIYILLTFVIGFSLWMRTIFVQDCSLKVNKNIAKDKENDGIDNIWENFVCKFEKYGGLQAIIATCFLVQMLSYTKNPTYKLFIFIILGLASGLLSSVFILNLK